MPKFVPRQRKHKARAREQSNGPKSAPTSDSNAVEILPPSKQAREVRRQQLREELKAQQPKISGKKAKRLDKYIDTKLKREENQELIKKLAASQIDTSLFHSARKLGQTEVTKRDIFKRALKEHAAGIDVERNTAILFEERRIPSPDLDIEDDDDNDDEPTVDQAKPTPLVQHAQTEKSFGSGLKRPLELDEDGKPIIKTRKKRKVKSLPVPPEEPEWEGFSGESGAEEEELRGLARAVSDGEEDSQSSAGEQDETEDEEDEDGSEEEEEDDDDDEESSSSDEISDSDKVKRRARSSAFKEWAVQQRNAAIGFTPSTNINALGDTSRLKLAQSLEFRPRPAEDDPLPLELQPTTNVDRKAFSVHVERSEGIQEARLALPVVAEEQKIMEAIHNNSIVIVQGATGSGKTTQVPQFLYEAGYGSPDGPTPGIIGVTQPRRVAAVSMAQRVRQEMGDAGSKVAYQIRFDKSTVSDSTAIKFMTDGILLREMATDFLLSRYSAIVLDEAHERSVNTDILIGMLSRSVQERLKHPDKLKPLKLIIMSATFREGDFIENTKLFNKGIPPIVQAEGRQYPVTIHFARQTRREYIDDVFAKISRGHGKLPPGGFLVFLTGQNEILALSKRLKEAFPATDKFEARSEKMSTTDTPFDIDDAEVGGNTNPQKDDFDEAESNSDDQSDDEFDIGEESTQDSPLKVHVLPLYSQLNQAQQLRVFEPAPDGSRAIILATNVAETSITIPGIRYVFDCGRAKNKHYDLDTGVQSFEIGWVSKASATQRAGRAGRTGPGHCYRLYSSAVYEAQFEEYPQPEILTSPLEGIILQLKSMGVPNVVNFPFPTSPDPESLSQAEKLLTYLGAIRDGKITSVGHELSNYPLSPRFARMLHDGQKKRLAPLTVALVAALAVPDIFIPENQILSAEQESEDEAEKEERERLRKAYNKAHADFSRWDRHSDALKLLRVIREHTRTPIRDRDAFSTSAFLRVKALREASQLRDQLTGIVSSRLVASGSISLTTSTPISRPDEKQILILKQILTSGFIDHIAIRADLSPNPPELLRKPKRAIDVPYITLFSSHIRSKMDEEETSNFVYLHPSSVLSHTPPAKLPKYIVYAYLQRASSSVPGRTPKVRMAALTDVSGTEIVQLALGTGLLEWTKQVRDVKDLGTGRREASSVPMLVGEKGKLGWPLPEARVAQRKEKNDWIVEKIL